MKTIVSLLLLTPLLSACDLIRYHPYEDIEPGSSGLTELNIERIERLGALSMKGGEGRIRFAFLSDTQRQYDDTRAAVDYVNRHDDIQFVLHGGDITDFGMTHEFEWMASELSRLDVPYLTAIGNHDFLGYGEHNYQRLFGPYNYSLNVGCLHLVVLNTSSRELGETLAVPDFAFLSTDIARVDSINRVKPDSITHTVLMMHARPGDDQFNDNVSIPFGQYIKRYPGMGDDDTLINEAWLDAMSERLPYSSSIDPLDREAIVGTHARAFCLCGHNHHHQLLRPLGDRTLFYGVPDVHSRQLFVFTIYSEGYDYECVDF